MREAHRADLHQALAYASLAQVERVDTLLVYPSERLEPPMALATLPAGRKRLRVLLCGLPFGFTGSTPRAEALARWRALLAA